MRYLLSFLLVFVITFSINGQTLEGYSVFGSGDVDLVYDVHIDDLGNVYIVGEFRDSADFDPGAGTHILVGDTSGDAFVAKYDSSYNLIWVDQITSHGHNWASGVRLNSNNELIVCGNFGDTASFLSSGDSIINRHQGWDGFVAKYSSAGVLIWAKEFGGRGTDEVYHLELSSTDEIYVAGMSQDSMSFDSGSVDTYFAGYRGYIARFSDGGTYKKLIYAGGTGLTDFRQFQIDNSGNIVATGSYKNKTWFDSGNNNDSLETNNFFDAFMVKYDSSGNVLWLHGYGGQNDDYGESIALDKKGDIYLGGRFIGLVDFSPGQPGGTLNASQGRDAFVNKYSTNGDLIWTGHMFGGHDVFVLDIIERNDLIYTTGRFAGIVDADIQPNSNYGLISSGVANLFVASYSPEGALHWASAIASNAYDLGMAVSVNAHNKMALAGGISFSVDIDLDTSQVLVSANILDAFVGTYEVPQCTQPDSLQFTVNDSIFCPNQNLKISIDPSVSLGSADHWSVYADSCGGSSLLDFSSNLGVVNLRKPTKVLIRAEGGCIRQVECQSQNIYVTEIDTGVNVSFNTLESKELNAKYQWYDCLNNVLLVGDTNRQLVSKSNYGEYAVILTKELCTDTSDCFVVDIENVNEYLNKPQLSVFPNPTSNKLTLKSNSRILSYQVSSMDGKKYVFNYSNQKELSFDVSSLPKGLYILEVSTESAVIRKRIMKD